MIASVAAFTILVRRESHATLAIAWFACTAPVSAFTGRVPFAVGFAAGLWTLVGASRKRRWRFMMGLAGGAGTALCSPVAALFLALVCTAWLVDSWWPPSRSPQGSGWLRSLMWRNSPPGALAAIAGSATVVAGLMVVFPEGGVFPFPPTALAPALGAVVLGTILVRKRNAVTIGLALFAIVCAVAFVVDSAAGANVVRLGTMTIGPVVALYLGDNKTGIATRWLVVFVPLCLWWAWWPVHFSTDNRHDRSATPQYFAPLLDALAKREAVHGFERIEVVPVLTHSEAWQVGGQRPIARGWERQIDRGKNSVLYDKKLTADQFHTWLLDSAVGLVALPITAKIDEGGVPEARLLSAPPDYLSEVWRNGDWRLYSVNDATPLVTGPAVISSVDAGHLVLHTIGPGEVTVRFVWARWLGVASGPACNFQRGAGDSIRFTATGPGDVRIESMVVGASASC